MAKPYQLGDSIGDYRLDPPPDDGEPDTLCTGCGEPSDSSVCDDCDFAEWVGRDVEVLCEEWAECASVGAVGAGP